MWIMADSEVEMTLDLDVKVGGWQSAGELSDDDVLVLDDEPMTLDVGDEPELELV